MKVYLGKSYQSNTEIVITLNDILRKNNVAIFKYQGGKYDPEIIQKADPDYVIIIPPMFTKKELEQIEDRVEHSFYIGKGNDSEARKLPGKTYFVIPDPDFEIGDNIKLINTESCTIEVKEYDFQRTFSKVEYNPEEVIDIRKLFDEEDNNPTDDKHHMRSGSLDDFLM